MKNTMGIARHPIGLILVLLMATLTLQAVALAEVEPSWIPTGNLNIPRSGHTATLLTNGKVVVVGGWNENRLNSAELYDPASGTWSITGSLNIARDGHTATLLANGKVLVAGGSGSYDGQQPGLNSAELYDPATGTWSVTGSLNIARDGHTATLLPNGKVLVVGGLFHGPTITSYTNSAELYDPATASWTFTGSLHTERAIHTATRLQNGKILVVGGTNVTIGFIIQPDGISSAELYDSATETWSVTGSLNIARSLHTATLLPNGNVLAAGGWATDSAELYDPATATWNSTGALHTPSYGDHTATLLRNGQVLLTGGWSGFAPISDAQLYDPATGTWRVTTSLSTAVLDHTATRLPNGKVLVAGGWDARQGRIQRLNSAEIYESPGVGITVTPSSGSGSFQTFSFDFFDPNGFANIFSAQLLVHSSLTAAGGCLLYYHRESNAVWLQNDSGSGWIGPSLLGSGTALQNKQCTVSAASSSAFGSSSNLTLNLALAFTSAFSGNKNIYALVHDNHGLTSDWQQEGTWTVPGGSQPPAILSVTPSSGSGSFQTFSFTFFDPNGFANVYSAPVLIHSSLTAAAGCFLYYHREANAVWLQNDSGSGWIGPSLLGSGAALQNSQCTVSAASSSAFGSGSNLTLNLALAFTSAFSGSKNSYAIAYDNEGFASNWQQTGTWTVPGGNQPPAVLSVIPSSGGGSFQAFSFTFFDPNGFANVYSAPVLIHSSLTAAGGCFLYYHRESNAVWLQNDSGSGWIGPSLLGSGAALQNSQCTVSAASSSAFGSGNNLTLNLALAFTPAFSGNKNSYAIAYDNEGFTSNWQQTGTWTVP